MNEATPAMKDAKEIKHALLEHVSPVLSVDSEPSDHRYLLTSMNDSDAAMPTAPIPVNIHPKNCNKSDNQRRNSANPSCITEKYLFQSFISLNLSRDSNNKSFNQSFAPMVLADEK